MLHWTSVFFNHRHIDVPESKLFTASGTSKCMQRTVVELLQRHTLVTRLLSQRISANTMLTHSVNSSLDHCSYWYEYRACAVLFCFEILSFLFVNRQ